MLIKKIITILYIAFLLILPGLTNAADEGYYNVKDKEACSKKSGVFLQIAIPVPGIGSVNCVSDLRGYLNLAYQFTVYIVGGVCVMIFMAAGIMWVFSGGQQEKVTKAKGMMTNAVIGTVLLFSSYTILRIINPAFVEMQPFNLTQLGQLDIRQMPNCNELEGPYPKDFSKPTIGELASIKCGTEYTVVDYDSNLAGNIIKLDKSLITKEPETRYQPKICTSWYCSGRTQYCDYEYNTDKTKKCLEIGPIYGNIQETNVTAGKIQLRILYKNKFGNISNSIIKLKTDKKPSWYKIQQFDTDKGSTSNWWDPIKLVNPKTYYNFVQEYLVEIADNTAQEKYKDIVLGYALEIKRSGAYSSWATYDKHGNVIYKVKEDGTRDILEGGDLENYYNGLNNEGKENFKQNLISLDELLVAIQNFNTLNQIESKDLQTRKGLIKNLIRIDVKITEW